ncbi:hypothetical protein CTEN210_03864 [Chaetoceros tenuissimus]|uniref:C6H2-type domain-containing protein n=1 Tax=Chaetoceros tenuissimus TaxID=426638 RepID=A0AAD3H2E4_9STRA|nr:hypothetical protein CTEN210_03864 [Chaetoceros tenuissimus]
MESTLLQTKCSGCSKLENEIKFQACPICIELKMLPSVYCCEECFRADWKTHKKKHDKFSNEKTKYLERYEVKPFKEYRKDLKKLTKEEEITPYTQTIMSIELAITAMDYDKAETLCRKAISRFPLLPEPYNEMAIILFNLNEFNDGIHFLEASMEKTCQLLLLTVENKSNDSDDELLLSHYFQRRRFVDKMNLICEYLQKAIESTAEPKFFVAHWIFDRKKFLSLWWYYLELIKDVDSMYGDPKLLDPKYITSLLESMKLRNQEFDINISLSPFYDGEWVIAHGLTSSVGKTLNHRVAMVKGDDLNDEGRVAIVFKEGGPIKNLKVENLKYARTVNAKAALLMFLDVSEQWKFMMDDFLAV